MKKIIFMLMIISSLYANEQNTKEPYDITKDWVYNGCKDELADKWTENRNYILGLAVAKKDATLDSMRMMSMITVNGVDTKKVCKWYFNVANDIEYSSKYLLSASDSKYTFLNLVEQSVVKDNGETYEKFSENIEKIRKLFKK